MSHAGPSPANPSHFFLTARSGWQRQLEVLRGAQTYYAVTQKQTQAGVTVTVVLVITASGNGTDSRTPSHWQAHSHCQWQAQAGVAPGPVKQVATASGNSIMILNDSIEIHDAELFNVVSSS